MTSPKKTSSTRASVTATQPAVANKAKTVTRAPSGTMTKSAATTPVKTMPTPVAEASAATPQAAAKAKHKLVRDSFTIPKSEYAVLEGLKLRAANLTRPVKKSELLRAGIAALQAMTDKAFLSALNEVPSLKTGRPKGANGASAAQTSTTK